MSLDANMFVFYVNDTAMSTQFYTDLLGQEPIHVEPTFVMFGLKSGLRLGLWSKQEVLPAAHMTGGGTELALQVPDDASVDLLYTQWLEKNIPMIQSPVMMDELYTFTCCDPDQHRIRIFSKGSRMV